MLGNAHDCSIMSLTSFLQEPDVRQRFRQEFNKPISRISKDLLAPPRSKRYSLVGTAFDYLLRFHIQRQNRVTDQQPWVAEASISILQNQSLMATYDLDTADYSFNLDSKLNIAQKGLALAKQEHQRFLVSGKLTMQLLESVILLAQLDVIYRSGYIDDSLGVAHEEDVEDLSKLLSIADIGHFKAKNICLLNPTFGGASALVGGADADLLVDDTLIDIKVTKIPKYDRMYFNQLIGYFVLHWLHGIGGIRPKLRILRIGVYFARQAHLEVYNLKELINTITFPSFAGWFVDRAKKQYPKHYDKYIELKWNSIVERFAGRAEF